MLRKTPIAEYLNPKTLSIEFVLRIVQMLCIVTAMLLKRDSFFAVYFVCLLQMAKGMVFENDVSLLSPERSYRVATNQIIGLISFCLLIRYYENDQFQNGIILLLLSIHLSYQSFVGNQKYHVNIQKLPIPLFIERCNYGKVPLLFV